MDGVVIIVHGDDGCVFAVFGLGVLWFAGLVVGAVTSALGRLRRIIAPNFLETDAHYLAHAVRAEGLNISKRIILRPLIAPINSLRHVEP